MPSPINPVVRLEELVKDFTYKPGWKFTVTESTFGVGVRVRADLTNISYMQWSEYQRVPMMDQANWEAIPKGKADRLINIPHEIIEDPNIPDKFIFDWLMREIHKLEGHETLEWARYKGQPVYDPHPGGGVVGSTHMNNSRYMLEVKIGMV